VQCNKSSDCATGLVCETSSSNYNLWHHCVQCTKNSDCSAGEVCNGTNLYTYPLYWQGNDTCGPDCRGNAGICKPGACEGDSGVCLSDTTVNTYYYNWPNYCSAQIQTSWCSTGADCQVDGGGGACNFTTNIFPFYYNNGYGYCVPCTVDGGGCTDPNEFCQTNSCPTPPDGVAGSCVFNCFMDAGACGLGTFCSDAGPMGVDGGNVGSCTSGCENISNCPATAPICSDGGCVQCAKAADCPDYAAGCQNNQCGNCASNSDCPMNEQCYNGRCGCSTDSDCPLDVPTCVGASGSYNGACACTDQSQCPGGYVCETRPPYAIYNGYSWCGSSVGGVCIAACLSNADCANFTGTGNGICDTTTGFCVPCTMDTDCTAGTDPSKPTITPSCVLYVDGGNPNTFPALYTGGGQCGCSDTSECNGGYKCSNPGYYGSCGPACSYVNGVDSCTPQYSYYYYCPNSYYPGPYCNTFTGNCQNCLTDYECTSRYCNTPFCSNGTCVGCFSGDDCQTFPNNACNGGNCSNSCSDNSQCPTDGGYTCQQTPPYGQNGCYITCTLGDDAGLGTVSDAGNSCPADAPLCVPNSYNSDSTQGICGSCLSSNDTTNCDAGNCPNYGYTYCYAPYCTMYYCY